jgi:hypothetical protein
VETIILEHSFEDRPFDIDRYNDAQQKNEWCLKIHGVRHIVSYLTPDSRRMICVFEAPDAEAVRRTAHELGYAYDSVWPATIVR